jgi:uncharacterized membrane protein
MILADTSRSLFEILGSLYARDPLFTIFLILGQLFIVAVCIIAIIQLFSPKKDEGGWGPWMGPGGY